MPETQPTNNKDAERALLLAAAGLLSSLRSIVDAASAKYFMPPETTNETRTCAEFVPGTKPSGTKTETGVTDPDETETPVTDKTEKKSTPKSEPKEKTKPPAKKSSKKTPLEETPVEIPGLPDILAQVAKACSETPEMKNTIKEWLASVGATKISEIPEDKLPEFLEILGGE